MLRQNSANNSEHTRPVPNRYGAHRQAWRLAIICLLVLACGGLGLYFHKVLHSDLVYTHFAYIPIILACMWWGRRGILVAVLIGALILALHFLGRDPTGVWSDLARVFFFLVVALCVGTLTEWVMAAQNSLHLSQEKYRILIDKSLAGIFVYRDEKILFANSRLSDMLGYAPQDMIGMPLWSLFHDQDRPKVRDLVLKREAEGTTDLHYDARFVARNGKVYWAEVLSSVSNYEGRPAVLVNVYNITDRKESEEKRRELSELARKQEEQLIHSTRLAELGEMAAAVAHELNQPLTGIRNFARNAFYMIEKDVGTPDEIKANLRLISEQVDRASKIISQMRALTRKADRQFALVDINSTVRESVEFLMPQFRLGGVEVTLDLARDLPNVWGDRIRLEQVFLNLLTNARHAMEETAVRHLRVKTHLSPGSPLPIRIAIIDTGKGFTPEEAAKLFRPFFTTKKPGQGTGLGLSISLSIVKDHHGTIVAEGAPGQGAKFTVNLPVAKEDNGPEGIAYND